MVVFPFLRTAETIDNGRVDVFFRLNRVVFVSFLVEKFHRAEQKIMRVIRYLRAAVKVELIDGGAQRRSPWIRQVLIARLSRNLTAEHVSLEGKQNALADIVVEQIGEGICVVGSGFDVM